MTKQHLSPRLLLRYSLQHLLDILKDCYSVLLLILNYAFITLKTTLLQIVKLLIYFTLLKFSNNLHILLTDRVIFEIIELCCIVGKIKKIDAAFMIIIEFFDVLLNIKIMAVLWLLYFPYLTILSVNYFFDWPAVHLLISSCLMFIVFSWSLNFFSWERTLL